MLQEQRAAKEVMELRTLVKALRQFHYKGDHVYNDYNFPYDEIGIGKRHFLIKFDDPSKSYFLKDLGEGTGTFIKLETPLKLVSGYIISFGDSHMTILIDEKKIVLKFLEGIRANEKRYCIQQSIYSRGTSCADRQR